LAIVQETVEQIGGSVDVHCEQGKGTTFIIRVPMSIATFRGVLVESARKQFMLPTANTESFIQARLDEIKTVENRSTLMVNGTLVPVCALENLLELPIASSYKIDPLQYVIVCVVRAGSERAGFIVDDVLGEQEVLVKTLGSVFSGATAVSGVTVLGSGRVAPILNAAELIRAQRAQKPSAMPRSASMNESISDKAPGKAAAERQGKLRKHILVVDDMVTARMLVRSILELAGYVVNTANDGGEAMDLLRAEHFDAVITDIEMPRMDGIVLTQSIRSDPRLSHLPVILLTNMASREDRERGVSAGANAYFVKNSFDQANLIDVVGTLVG